jgi:two-component system NtrC family sensor kinase
VPWRRLFERPARLLALLLGLVLVWSVASLAGLSWRNHRRMQRIRAHVEHTARIQKVGLELQWSLLAELAGTGGVDRSLRAQLRRELAGILLLDANLDPLTAPLLTRLDHLLENDPLSRSNLMEGFGLVRDVVTGEMRGESGLLAQISADTRRELWLVIAIGIALSALAGLGTWNLRRRIVEPLRDLQALLAQLGSGDFEAVSAHGVHPLLEPLFENYNRLVTRLQELEAQHRSRADSLESEVRAATQTLLEQQRLLARAERLAAVGETAAGLAHELRNPLAGVLMSLANLRRDLGDPDLVERLDLVVAEIQRLTRLLNDSLSTARHAPEPARSVHLRTLVGDLLALLRYQVPSRVRLECRVPDDLDCSVPRDRIRQALLNLILNSVQALGDQTGEVTVSARRRAEELTICVEDDGPGFSSDLLRNGIQAFSTRRETGTGLGLAMVRRVALDLGGRLLLENRDTRGARACLVLPCRRA